MRTALVSGKVQLFSWCPVEHLKQDNGGWEVKCHERGTIKAKEVIVCTNGYSRNLFNDHPISQQ